MSSSLISTTTRNRAPAASSAYWIANTIQKLAEAPNLRCLGLRVEGKVEWDPIKMKITNNADANKYLKPTFRKGWSFSG